MLSLACRNTNKLIREKSQRENIRLGRFFTKKDTAKIMADMFTLRADKTAYTILDPGAGTGILSAAIIERICREVPECKQIFLTAYETDERFLPMLEDNLERIRKKARHDYGVKVYPTVYAENYIVDSKNHYTVNFFTTVPDTFDLIICNPPTEFCDKVSKEAEVAGGVTQVKISEAFLFAKMAMGHLEPKGQLVINLPTIVATASQLTALRQELSENLAIKKVHLFVGKQKNENRATPLKKNLILAYEKAQKPENVLISVSNDDASDCSLVLPPLPYGFVVDEKDGTLTLPKSVEDTKIVNLITALPETLASLGLKMCTGLVLESRCDGFLFSDPAVTDVVPLIRPLCLKEGRVVHPLPGKHQYISALAGASVQRNKNMIFIKRVPAVGDDKLINAALHLSSSMREYDYIGTHNKINFIDTKSDLGEMSARFAYGVYCLLNSTVYDRYVSIVSKSRQINSKEFRTLPMPDRSVIESIGMRLMDTGRLTTAACDAIVNPALHISEK